MLDSKLSLFVFWNECAEYRRRRITSGLLSEQILKLLKRIEMQERGEIEPPPIVIGRPLADMDGNPVMDSMDDEYDGTALIRSLPSPSPAPRLPSPPAAFTPWAMEPLRFVLTLPYASELWRILHQKKIIFPC